MIRGQLDAMHTQKKRALSKLGVFGGASGTSVGKTKARAATRGPAMTRTPTKGPAMKASRNLGEPVASRNLRYNRPCQRTKQDKRPSRLWLSSFREPVLPRCSFRARKTSSRPSPSRSQTLPPL